jgi:asparagine synthase (glutamine-hydrolysing)
MCGIAGFVQFSAGLETSSQEARLRRMIATIRHRGPDASDIWTDNTCGLAHARLSIIDLSSAAGQPMTTHDGKYWVVFNGEIYNYQEIRTALIGRGCSFRTQSDTETILEGYRIWGDKVIDHLRGMFAFALWDPARQRMLLARDRLGKKPLYWARIGETFVFGSELKAIVSWPGLNRSPNHAAIDQYLTYQYIPAPLTIFEGVSKLEAANKLIVERKNDRWVVGTPERYWRLPTPSSKPAWMFDARQKQEELINLLKESIRLRMISDVPLGAFLSGGVDSSAVVAMMAQVSDRPVKTFSIGSPHPEYDETKYARQVAERYGTDHEELILEPNAADVLQRLVWHYNEPYADASMIPTYYVSEMARRHVTVVLNGDGGDEALMGYPRYDTVRGLAEFDAVPKSLAPLARRLAGALPSFVRTGPHQVKLDRFMQRMSERNERYSRRYAFTIVSMPDSMKQEAYGPAMQEHLATSALDLLDPFFDEANDFLSGANWADTHLYLPEDLMVKVDVASMSVSLEPRSPLLDHKLMEWAFSLPASVKTPGGIAKGLFKKAMEPYLPNELLYRPKMGFGCPIDHWLRADLKEIAYDILLSDRATKRGIIKREIVERMLDEHVNMVSAHHTRLFALLNLELWFRMWLDASPEEALERPELGARLGGGEMPASQPSVGEHSHLTA